MSKCNDEQTNFMNKKEKYLKAISPLIENNPW